MTDYKFFLADLKTKLADKPEGYITGIASTWNKDLGGDKVEQGAFSKTIPSFMKNPVMLFSHQLDKPIGKWTSLNETESGLEVSGQINLKTDMGRNTYELIKNNDVKGLSIGYSVVDSDVIGDTNILKQIDLWEISIVSIPMNQQAWLTGAKIFNPDETKTHFDASTKWVTVARSMVDLLSNSFIYRDLTPEEKEAEFNYMAGYYRKFKKELPEVDFKELKFKDIEFKNDEKFIYEFENVKNKTQSISDILKHWQSDNRSIPIEDIPELEDIIKGLYELLPAQEKASTDEGAYPDLNLSEMSEQVKLLEAKIKSKQDASNALKDEFNQIVKDTIRKATGINV